MCRAGPAPVTTTTSSSRRRRVVTPISPSSLLEQVVNANAKQQPQQQSQPQQHRCQYETTPTTISTDESLDDSSSDNLSTDGNDMDESSQYPVLGRYSNVLEDYFIFPTVLGTGHYGTVRECLHRRTRECFAIKSIEKAKIGRLDHLQREVTILSQLSKGSHPSIMKLIDCFEDAEYVHIVTEKYTGGELFDKIIDCTTEDGCFPEEKAAKIVKSLLEAVQYLHRNGVVHRDIKPENILFEKKEDGIDSPIRLIDFGLSRTHDAHLEGMMSNPVGTAYYMSPELLKGKYDKACDVWSIGIVAYILLCGYPPFNGETDPDIWEAIKKETLNFSGPAWHTKRRSKASIAASIKGTNSSTKPSVSEEAREFISALLQKDPRNRLDAQQALEHSWMKKYSPVVAEKEEKRRLNKNDFKYKIRLMRSSNVVRPQPV